MGGRVDDHVPLDYAEIQIFPSQNRYEVGICSKGKVENLEDGVLELLSPHLPSVKDLFSKGSNSTFKLSPPSNTVKTWFTKSTLNRFLQIVRSSNVVHTASSVKDEMCQLEEARKFHVSLYGQPKVENASSDNSKNELLRAMDLRLTALRAELTSAFCNAASAICSSKEITNLANFSKHFGGVDLRNSLHKLSEVNRESHNKRSLATSTKNDGNEMDRDTNAMKPIPSETLVMYGVSPAKAAQVERQSSTDGSEKEESDASVQSDEDVQSAERSRTLMRSATPRRSASPMRRVQIGRGGSRRAAALTIKSLNYYPVRDKSFPYRDGAGNSSEEEEGSGQSMRKPEGHVRRMSVQDAISLFENKQKDRVDDSQLRKSLSALSVTANKSVLRRWSSGVGETSALCEPEPEEVVATTGPSDVANYESVEYSAEEKLELETVAAGQEVIEIPENNCADSERFEKGSCDPKEIHDTKKTVNVEDDTKKSTATTEWNRAKEAELNQMLMQMMEAKPAKYTKAHPSRKQSLPSGQRGGFYDHYKEKRDEKLRGENVKKKAEKEAQFKAMQQILDERKAEMASKNSNDVVEKKPATRKPQKTLRNSPQPSIPKKETPPKAVVSKKISPLPPTRKSWPSTPPARATAISPAKTPVPNSSANTTPTRRKTQQTQSLPRAAPRVERSQQPQRSAKEPPVESGKSTKTAKSANEKPQLAPRKTGKVTKTKRVTTSAEDISDVVPAKPGLYSKVTKKSTVVPVEPKPFLRKGARTTASINKKNSELEEPQKNSTGDLAEVLGPEPASQHQGDDLTSAPDSDAAAGSEDPANAHQESSGTEKNPDSAPAEEEKSPGDLSAEIRAEEEPVIISPSAWVEIEEQRGVGDRSAPGNAAATGSASPRVRHSLSQMLLEESNEPDTVEWGNAEIPPAAMYQKDAPKGFKRLLKFARKSKGDANSSSGFSSPSVFSEGEDDSDGFMKKAALSAKNHGQQKTLLCEGYDARDLLYPAKSNVGKLNGRSNLQKLHESSDSAAVPSTKATRSFFSLSAFRGGAK